MKRWSLVLGSFMALASATTVLAFPKSGTDGGDCSGCHRLSRDDAKGLLGDLVKDVIRVERSEVGGLWVLDVENANGQKGPLYMDFSKTYVFGGNILNVKTRESITQKRLIELNRIDVGRIPLDDAVVIGSPTAKQKVVVFTDPSCPYCQKLHPEIKKLAASEPDVAFYVKMYPIKDDPEALARTKAVACTRSLETLDEAMAGKDVRAPDCQTDALDKNLALGREIGVRSTPTLVFPDGRVIPGAMTSEQILEVLRQSTAALVPKEGHPR